MKKVINVLRNSTDIDLREVRELIVMFWLAVVLTGGLLVSIKNEFLIGIFAMGIGCYYAVRHMKKLPRTQEEINLEKSNFVR